MKQAKFIKDVSENFNGQAELYLLEDGEYVVVSAVSNWIANETMIFSADEYGNVTHWGELAVIRYPDVTDALAEYGYEVSLGELVVVPLKELE